MRRNEYRNLSTNRSPATCCTRLCNFISSFGLQLFNFFDLIFGTILISLGIYVKFMLPDNGDLVEHQTLVTIGFVSFIIGVLFILVSLFSFCGIVSGSCRFAVIPSGYLALILAMTSLLGGIAAIIFDDKILDFIDANQKKLNLNSDQIQYIHVFYDIISVVLFTSFFIEVIRFMLSSQYNSTSNLLNINGDIEAESLLRNKDTRYQTADDPTYSDTRYNPYQKRINSLKNNNNESSYRNDSYHTNKGSNRYAPRDRNPL